MSDEKKVNKAEEVPEENGVELMEEELAQVSSGTVCGAPPNPPGASLFPPSSEE